VSPVGLRFLVAITSLGLVAAGCYSITTPGDTSRIVLVSSNTYNGWRLEYYENRAYTCAMSGYQTFVLGWPEGVPTDEVRPLWVRMHGGGVGSFAEDGTYQPPQFFPGSLDQETYPELRWHGVGEPGLMGKIRAHPAGFRLLMPSMCDHDLYAGVGVPDPHNPFNPDENNKQRAADGLLATKAAITFARERVATSHTFLHGTSAGSLGSYANSFALELEGLRLSGIVADSWAPHDRYAEEIREFLATGACGPQERDTEGVKARIGPAADPTRFPEHTIPTGEYTVPIMEVWSRRDTNICNAELTITDEYGTRTKTVVDWRHEPVRQAIEDQGPTSPSAWLRVCVDGGSVQCGQHSPTRVDGIDNDAPPGMQDYNQRIIDWVSIRLQDPLPA
jgi:hypothetical protein